MRWPTMSMDSGVRRGRMLPSEAIFLRGVRRKMACFVTGRVIQRPQVSLLKETATIGWRSLVARGAGAEVTEGQTTDRKCRNQSPKIRNLLIENVRQANPNSAANLDSVRLQGTPSNDPIGSAARTLFSSKKTLVLPKKTLADARCC